MKTILLFTCFVFLVGCETVSTNNNQVYSASYLGDRDSYSFDSMTVSVKDKNNKTINLNVVFSATVNPKESFISSTSYSELRGLISRLQTRIKSQIIQELLSFPTETITNRQLLHNKLTNKAQSIFDAEYNKWTKSSYFEVKIVITSLYFTDMSVGVTPTSRRWW